jgi:3-oxoacyl-[acyl-carrier-protein] synthase-1
MHRVVVTGLGIVSPIGNDSKEVLTSLWRGRSGIVFMPEMQDLGFKCCLYGPVKQLDSSVIGKKGQQTMSEVSKYATVAALEALEDADLDPEDFQRKKTGVIVGTGLGGIGEATRLEQMMASHTSLSRAGASGPVKIMNSTAAVNLAAYLGVEGRAYSLSTACCTGPDNIGHAYEMLKYGLMEVCITGAAEENGWKQVGASFDNSGEMPRTWNDRASQACRPYDRDRQGFVLSAGAGILILETLEHAQRRGARIYAEVIGYGASNDGADMFRPTGQGLKRSIHQALKSASQYGINSFDYINPHGTGTQIGDMVEVQVIKEIFTNGVLVSSTKGLSGHALGATGAQEAVYTLLMLSHDFVAATANLDNISSECTGIGHVQRVREVSLETVMTFNSGLAGTNACLIFRKLLGEA